MTAVAKYIVVAVIFSGSGILSNILFGLTGENNLKLAMVGLPFGAAAALLCTRPLALAPVVAVLDCVAWLVAFHVALHFSHHGVSEYPTMIAAGLVGAVGVVLASAAGNKKLLSWRVLAGGAMVGGIAAVPFAAFAAAERKSVAIPFAIWQAAAGTYLYVIHTRRSSA